MAEQSNWITIIFSIYPLPSLKRSLQGKLQWKGSKSSCLSCMKSFHFRMFWVGALIPAPRQVNDHPAAAVISPFVSLSVVRDGTKGSICCQELNRAPWKPFWNVVHKKKQKNTHLWNNEPPRQWEKIHKWKTNKTKASQSWLRSFQFAVVVRSESIQTGKSPRSNTQEQTDAH